MKKIIFLALLFAYIGTPSYAQTNPGTRPTANPGAQRQAAPMDLTEYGVSFRIEPRLIIMMAALDAAGFEPGTSGTSAFRAQVKKDLANLDPDLRNRLRTFYERNKLPAPATPAEQAARYVSLAFALGPPPTLQAPARSEDLPASLLEVLDFAPLVQEFYRGSNIEQRLADYTRTYQIEADRLQRPTGEMVTAVLSYLHTRPITTSRDRIQIKPKTTPKRNQPPTYAIRELERRFIVVPDLLGAPGAINFRVIADEYYAVLPEGTDPATSELQRGYFQYVVDPILVRFNREIAARREQIKQVIAEREKSGAAVSPDVFLAVSRSLAAAADVRLGETRRLEALAQEARAKLALAKDASARQAISKDFQTATAAIQDESVARLAEQYERGGILAFFFAEQLKGLEASGFDFANFFVDMISSFDPAREGRRLAENSEARQRALAARQARLSARRVEFETPVYTPAEAARAAALVKRLEEIEQVFRTKDYPSAEAQLKDLLKEYSREPRIFFALAQTASFAAGDATDENVQAERLNRALANYRFAVEASSPETDRALISRAHEAMGRIYAFLDNNAEAAKEFDESIRVGDVPGGAYKEAVEGRKKIAQP